MKSNKNNTRFGSSHISRHKFIISIFILLVTVLLNCGAEEKKIVLSGYITIDAVDADKNGELNLSEIGPLFMAVSTSSEIELLEKDPMNYIKKITYIDSNNKFFKIDLSEVGIDIGDEISIFAFADNDYTNAIPYPTVGDIVGFYIDPKNFNFTYKVKEANNNLEIKVNRRYYDFEAEITGNIIGETNGEILVVAYNSNTDFFENQNANINIDDILGYTRITKKEESAPYTLPIFPYGYNVPMENIYVFAVIDSNNNTNIDEGEEIGYYINNDNLDLTLTINNGVNSGIDIRIDRTYRKNNSGIKGTITGENEDSGDVIITAYNGGIDSLNLNNLDINSIIGYQTISNCAFPHKYQLEILPFYTFPIEDVNVFAIIDKNKNGLPDYDEKIGYYINEEELSPILTISEEGLTDIDIDIDKTFSQNNARIEGKISGDDNEDVIIVAYIGSLMTLDVENLNIDSIIGYQSVPNCTFPYDYSLSILPTFDFPIENISVFAIQDQNGNGNPDYGEKIGFYLNFENDNIIMTTELNNNNHVLKDIDIQINKRLYEHNSSLRFTITKGSIPNTDENICEGEICSGAEVIIFLVHAAGIDFSTDPFNYNFEIRDLDYTIGMGTVTIGDSTYWQYYDKRHDYWYEVNLFPAFKDSINIESPFGINDVFVFSVLDSNRNGLPDFGEYIGFNFTIKPILIYYPEMMDINDGADWLSGGFYWGLDYFNRSVRFSNQQF